MIWLLVQIPLAKLNDKRPTSLVINRKEYSLLNALMGFNCLVLAVIAAFRSNSVGTDTRTYNYWFTQLGEYGLLEIGDWSKSSNIEMGIGVLAKIGLLIFDSNHGAWLILNIVMFWALYEFVKTYSYNYAFSIFLFLCFSLLNQSFNISGQFIAGGLLLASLVSLNKGNIKRYIFYLVLAYFAHRSAIIGLFFFPMYKIKRNVVKISLITVVASFILSRFASIIIPFIVSRTIYSHYLFSEVSSESGIGLIMNILLLVSFICFYKDMQKIDNNTNIWVFAAAATVSLNFFISSLGMIARVMVYFKLLYLGSIPCLSMAIKNRVKSKILAESVSIVIIMLFAVYYLYSLTHSTCFDTVPYVFEWF